MRRNGCATTGADATQSACNRSDPVRNPIFSPPAERKQRRKRSVPSGTKLIKITGLPSFHAVPSSHCDPYGATETARTQDSRPSHRKALQKTQSSRGYFPRSGQYKRALPGRGAGEPWRYRVCKHGDEYTNPQSWAEARKAPAQAGRTLPSLPIGQIRFWSGQTLDRSATSLGIQKCRVLAQPLTPD